MRHGFILLLLLVPALAAQSTDTLSTETAEIVVTANRMERSLADVAVPVQLIQAADLADKAHLRLSDLLKTLPNLQVHTFLGQGIQMQGLDADYTLVLLDGEPIIGRNGGTLDLDRIDLSTVERIELVRGASSSLYGSEAMGGVINIITKRIEKSEANAQVRYGSFNNLYLSSGYSATQARTGFQLQYTFNRSDGYDVGFDGIDPIATPFVEHRVQHKLQYKNAELRLNWNCAEQDSKSQFEVGLSNINEVRNDWNVGFTLKHQPQIGRTLNLRSFVARYQNDLNIRLVTTNTLTENTRFDQYLAKTELQYDRLLDEKRFLNVGFGAQQESVLATRLANERKTNAGGFLFGQYIRQLHRKEWTLGLRIDQNGVYKTAISPKIAFFKRLTTGKTFRMSLGRGFKAPTFQQLYLDFNNPAVGYSVFGAENIVAGLEQLTRQGQIQSQIREVEAVSLKPEYGNTLNIGYEIPLYQGRFVGNFFYNDVQNLIETAPVAIKTNNAQVFTYFNLNRVFTSGIETEWKRNFKKVKLGAGYTFLMTGDYAVLSEIRKGNLYTLNAEGQVRKMRFLDYGGLNNRSKHVFNVFINHPFQIKNFGAWEQHLNVRYNGRYGFRDVNGNLVLDDSREYVKGYFLVNWNLQKPIKKVGNFTLGIDNVLDAQRTEIPSLFPRTFFTALSIRF